MKEIVFIILFLAQGLPIGSQPQFRFQNFNTRDGLSHHQVGHLLMDSRGFLWVGTEFGLNRFDGVTFEKWFHIPGDTTSLINNKINNLAEDHLQHLWIATEKGISIYDTRKGLFKSFAAIQTINSGTIVLEQPGVFCDQDGDIWIGSARGAAILFKMATKEFFHIPILLAPQERMQNKYVGGFLHDRKNRIWVATSYGIYQLDKNKLLATAYRIDKSHANEPLLNSTTQLFETQQGLLLCGTWNAGYLIFDEATGRFKPFYSEQGPFLPSQVVFSFGQYHSALFFATTGGLYYCEEQDLLTPGFTDYDILQTDRNDPFSLASSNVNSFVTDVNDNLWIGGEGVSLLSNNYKHYKTFSFNSISNPAGSPVSLSQNGDQILVGVNGEVLVFDLSTEKFSKEKIRLQELGFHKFIKSGNNFYQTGKSGLIVYDEKFNFLTTIKELHPNGWPMNIYDAMHDHEGNTWTVTSRYGLRKHEANGKIISFLHDSTQMDHSIGDIIGSMLQSHNGDIYAGGKALFILKKGGKEFTSRSILQGKDRNEIRSLAMNGDVLWIGSRNGLYSYDETTEIIHRHHIPADINQVVEEIVIDDSGKVWMITSSGLIKYNPADSSTQLLNEKTGWPGNYSALTKLDDGRIVAGSEGSIVIIHPAEILPDRFSPPPAVTKLVIDEDESYLMPDSSTVYRIKYNQLIRFDFISLTYHNAANNKYAWQLKGLDDRWHAERNLTSQPFASLSPGHYTFSVKSANAGNIWSNTAASIHFIVLPPFYRTGWFVTMMVMAMLGVIYLIYRYRLKKALQIERMRTRIATDLHDDIGATLSSISFYSEAVHQRTKNTLPEVSPILEKMGETSRSMVSSMSDIVWAINPLNDDMSKMLERMKAYARDLSSVRDKNIDVAIDEKEHHLRPQLEQRRNIYLIFKEAVMNALKHAECNDIKVGITLKGNAFHMRIADDGRGFDTSLEGDGNGIRNMQRRAKEIGATIQIVSKPGKGTTIDLELLML